MVFRNTNSTVAVRKSAILTHFDNLYGELNTNSRFDSLFNRLLKNAQQTIDTISLNSNLNEGNKKMGILMGLGGSLHMVRDFHSHSDWIYNDFAKMGNPDGWPFKVQSRVYPPPGNSPTTHTHMNHDNSQLFYEGASQGSFHNARAIPAATESSSSSIS